MKIHLKIIALLFFISLAAVSTIEIHAPSPKGEVFVNGIKIPVEFATTAAQIKKGLSGRETLAENSGMLFVFAKPDFHKFWMPDMNFPLDIIWINNNEVVGVTENASNNFNPLNPELYSPSSPAQYALEVNAGFAARHGIKMGDKIILEK